MDSDSLFSKTALPSYPASRQAFRLQPSRSMPQLSSPLTLQRYKAKMQFMRTFREFSAAGQRRVWRSKLRPQLEYLGELQRLKLKPEPSLFCGSPKQVNFQGFGMGDNYAAAVSMALSQSQTVETLNLRSNRLRESGSSKLIQQAIGPNLRELNLSENQLGAESVSVLAAALASPDSMLEVLGLEKAVQRKEHICVLLHSLLDNKHLKSLNLARNDLSILCAKALRTFFAKNQGLETLDLHWNALNGPAAVLAFSGLALNSRLRVLDLSWNSLGHSPQVSDMLARVVRENFTLLHLDLSNNYLTSSDVDSLAEGLRSNHTLCGLHVEGNEGVQDAKGFLWPDKTRRKDQDGHLSSRLLSRMTYRSVKKPPETCWLCNKWQEAVFLWDAKEVAWPRRTKPDLTTAPLLHLDLDGFQPCPMLQQLDGSWRVTRAVPRQAVRFFFTYHAHAQVSFSYSVVTPLKPLQLTLELMKGAPRTLEVATLNEAVPTGALCTLEDAFPVEPRDSDWVFAPWVKHVEDPVPEWSISQSIFKTYKLDTESVLQECMDSDLRHSNILSLFSPEAFARVQPTLSLAYKHL